MLLPVICWHLRNRTLVSKLNRTIWTLSGTTINVKKTATIETCIKRFKQFKCNKNNDEETAEEERILTIPNMLCFTRITLSPVLSYCIISNELPSAIIILAFAGITDAMDGMIARSFKNQASKLGSFLDPLADKILVLNVFISLTYAHLIPLALTSVVVIRDILLLSAACYIRYKYMDERPRSMIKFINWENNKVQLKPTKLSKINTSVQLVVAIGSLCAPLMPHVISSTTLSILWYTAATTTFASGISYILASNTFTVSGRKF